MKSKALALQEELLQLDADRVLLYDAMENRFERPPSTVRVVPVAPIVDVRTGPHDDGDPVVRAAINEESSTRQEAHINMVMQLNAFQKRLCNVLGIEVQQRLPEEETTYLGFMTTREPILGGDEGITTTITYGPQLFSYTNTRSYVLRMTLRDMIIEVHAATTRELLTAIQRGYTCMRILSKGTRYYHRETGNGINIPGG